MYIYGCRTLQVQNNIYEVPGLSLLYTNDFMQIYIFWKNTSRTANKFWNWLGWLWYGSVECGHT